MRRLAAHAWGGRLFQPSCSIKLACGSAVAPVAALFSVRHGAGWTATALFGWIGCSNSALYSMRDARCKAHAAQRRAPSSAEGQALRLKDARSITILSRPYIIANKPLFLRQAVYSTLRLISQITRLKTLTMQEAQPQDGLRESLSAAGQQQTQQLLVACHQLLEASGGSGSGDAAQLEQLQERYLSVAGALRQTLEQCRDLEEAAAAAAGASTSSGGLRRGKSARARRSKAQLN